MKNDAQAFTRIELLAVIVSVCAVMMIPLAAASKNRNASMTAVDLSNVRQIMRAMTLYTADNSEHLPHPTWGTIPSGPDGWAYATRNRGGYPDLPGGSIPSAIGRLDKSLQVPWARRGLLGRYVNSIDIYECPKDVQDRHFPPYNRTYRERSNKVTSYEWSGAVCGYGGTEVKNASLGATYRLSDFNGSDILQWETDERIAFNFNDAAVNVANLNEGVSDRHGRGQTSISSGPQTLMGASSVGFFAGHAEMMRIHQLYAMRREGNQGNPNSIWCGPGFR